MAPRMSYLPLLAQAARDHFQVQSPKPHPLEQTLTCRPLPHLMMCRRAGGATTRRVSAMVRVQRSTPQMVRLPSPSPMVFNPRRPTGNRRKQACRRVGHPACMMTPRTLRGRRGIPTGVLYDMFVGGGLLPWTLTVRVHLPRFDSRPLRRRDRALGDELRSEYGA